MTGIGEVITSTNTASPGEKLWILSECAVARHRATARPCRHLEERR